MRDFIFDEKKFLDGNQETRYLKLNFRTIFSTQTVLVRERVIIYLHNEIMKIT